MWAPAMSAAMTPSEIPQTIKTAAFAFLDTPDIARATVAPAPGPKRSSLSRLPCSCSPS